MLPPRHYLVNHVCSPNFVDELPSEKNTPNIEEDYTFVQHVKSALGI